MTKIKEIQILEQLTMNALPAKTMMELDGWYLRYTAGFTKRANSIYPLQEPDKPLDSLLEMCEEWYDHKSFPAVFKMTEATEPSELDAFLQKHQYVRQDETSVQVLDYEKYNPEEIDLKVIYSDQFNERWFTHVCGFNQVEKRFVDIFKALLCRIEARVCYALVLDDDNQTVLACGLGVLENEYFGLYDIVTNPDYRNRGIGRKLVHGLLQWGRDEGAQRAYLQVIKENAPARHLYDKLGFEEAYTYWYRVKE